MSRPGCPGDVSRQPSARGSEQRLVSTGTPAIRLQGSVGYHLQPGWVGRGRRSHPVVCKHRASGLAQPRHPGFRRILTRQLQDLARLGVDGVRLQDFFARPLDFNPAAGKAPDRASWQGGIECIEGLLGACRAVNPMFCISVDLVWDRILPLSQTVSMNQPRNSAFRAAFPSCRPEFTIAEGHDFSAVNDAVVWGARLRIRRATRSTSGAAELSDLAGYLGVVLAARSTLSHTLIDGELLDAEELEVEGVPSFSTFRNSRTGLRSAVLVNPRVQPVSVTVTGFTGSSSVRDNARVVLWQPSAGATQIDLPVELNIPGDQLAILTEEETALDRLARVDPWVPAAGGGQRFILFAFRSASDLEGWSVQGDTFTVCSLPGLCRAHFQLVGSEGRIGYRHRAVSTLHGRPEV